MTYRDDELNIINAEPIKNPEDLEKIRSNLNNNPRNLLLFDLITQTGIGMKKLLLLKVKDLLGVKAGERIAIQASKNGKYDNKMTEIIYKSFFDYMNMAELKPDDFLFKSKKGEKPINLSSASNIIKEWFDNANIRSVHCATSLRKTWEYNRMKNISINDDKSSSSIISSGIFKPIETTSAQDIIFNKLSEAIISCKIAPGSRLTTSEIAKAFNVSHAPARVALNWLEAKGFITSKKKKASIVKELSINELKEIMHIRLILESAAIELSYKICTEETLKLAESIIYRYEYVDNLEEHDKLNTMFHQILYRDAGMPILTQLIANLCDRVSPYVILYHSNRPAGQDYHTAHIYHREMIEGMRQNDPEKVRKNLILDLNKSTASLEKILETRGKSHPDGSPLSFTF